MYKGYDHEAYIAANKKSKTYSDWRLPTIKELLTLVNLKKCNPACDLEDTLPDYYWASSETVSDSSDAWEVSFITGYTYNYRNRSNKSYIRCVRDGDNGLEWSSSSSEKMTWKNAFSYAKNLVTSVYYKEKQDD